MVLSFAYLHKMGMTSAISVQGNKAEELPEQVLCCIRLNGINYTEYHQLVVT